MAVYYNEHNPFAAAWLRNLIGAGRLPPATLMSETFEMCEQMTFEGLTSATSLRGSADGRSLSGLQDGPASDSDTSRWASPPSPQAAARAPPPP